jgi:nuclear pore complex protein Nup160
MDHSDIRYLFKETRLNLEPSSAGLVVNIRVPSPSSHSRSIHGNLTNGETRDTEAETIFDLKNLSRASSIYHRKWSESPRSFLWRVLDDDQVISVRALDICRQDKTADATLVLNFNFSVPINRACIALADPHDHDALCIFVIDQANYLYSFSLRPDLFRRRSSLELSIGDICKAYMPVAVGSKYAHRLVAINADQILITLHDGAVVRLDRNKGQDGKSPRRPGCQLEDIL